LAELSSSEKIQSNSGSVIVKIEFKSKLSYIANVYYIDHEGQRANYGELKPNDSFKIQSYDEFVWLVADQFNENLVFIYKVTKQEDQVITINTSDMKYIDQKPKYQFVFFPSYGPSPLDVYQGATADCWFLQSLCSSTWDHPEIVKSLFVNQEVNTLGFYVVKLWSVDENTYFYMVVDDIIPFRGDKPKYLGFTNARTDSKETGIWTVIIEKTMAKLMNSWDKLDTGNSPNESSLTTFQRILKGGAEWYDWRSIEVKPNDLWVKIKEIKGRGSSISLTSAGTTKYEVEDGMVNYHGYALFEIRTVNTNKGSVNLIKAKNVWGHTEWTGAWSDNSQEFIDNPLLVTELKLVRADDGVFWMCIEDFVKHFWIIWYN